MPRTRSKFIEKAIQQAKVLEDCGVSRLEILLCAVFWTITPGATFFLSCYFSYRLAKCEQTPKVIEVNFK